MRTSASFQLASTADELPPDSSPIAYIEDRPPKFWVKVFG